MHRKKVVRDRNFKEVLVIMLQVILLFTVIRIRVFYVIFTVIICTDASSLFLIPFSFTFTMFHARY